MKTFLISLVAALFVAGQFFAPAAAASMASGSCTSNYTVQNGDTLQKIADLCGTTVSNLLELNPQIANPNLIVTGQQLLIRGRPPQAIRITYISTTPTTYTVKEGDTFLKIATEHNTTIWEIIQDNPGLTFFTKLTPGMELHIPASTRISSYTIYRTAVIYYPNARVTLSATQAQAGDDIHVYVSGFPPGAGIDYKIGRYGSDYTYLYDGTIDAEGNAELTFEIPSTVKKGDSWVVSVATTTQKDGISATSPLISITE